MRKTKDLLKETFGSIPNSFAYREVRFHVWHALQKLETLERREAARKKDYLEAEQKKEEAKKLQPWQPPIYQTPSQILQTLDIIDQMIGEEKKVIENIHQAQQAKTTKGQVVPQEDDDENDDLQTLHG